MIRFQEMVPDWYIEKSRDFQVLCRMYDFVLNSVKYNADSMQALTDTRRVKDTVLPLLGDKLGIYDKEAYSNRQLLDALPIAIKYKGALKSINVLLNAFLDSMNVFDNVLALYAKNEEEAQEINDMLNRNDIVPFTIVIIFSTFPSLTNLHVLNEYMKMVLPTGMFVEYAFGVRKQYLDKFKYKEYVFLYYTSTRTYEDKPMTVPMVGMVKNKDEKYSSAFTYAGTTNIRTRKELVGDENKQYIHTLKHQAVPIPPATDVIIYKVVLDSESGEQISKDRIAYNPDRIYVITPDKGTIVYLEYSFNKTQEFIERLNDEGFDVNAVSIGTIMSKDQVEIEDE